MVYRISMSYRVSYIVFGFSWHIEFCGLQIWHVHIVYHWTVWIWNLINFSFFLRILTINCSESMTCCGNLSRIVFCSPPAISGLSCMLWLCWVLGFLSEELRRATPEPPALPSPSDCSVLSDDDSCAWVAAPPAPPAAPAMGAVSCCWVMETLAVLPLMPLTRATVV